MILSFALAILFLIACSATVSATETAMTAASIPAIEARAREGDPAAKRLASLLSNKENTIGSLLLANNVFNILGAALATDLFLRLIGEAGVAVATLVMTVLLVIFAEVLPKTYAIRDPERFAMRVSLPASILVQVTRPISYLLGKVVYATLKLLRVDESAIGSLPPAQQLRSVLAGYRGDHRLGQRRRQMLKGVLELDRARIDVALTHRSRIVSFPVDRTTGELIAEFHNVPHSRLPLWQDQPDNIVGVLHSRDLIGAGPNTPLRDLMREPWFVPITSTLQAQLDAFIERRAHLALVVDEYGDLKGLVTLEDIIEEITGEIDDETDGVRPNIILDDAGSALVPGHMPVGEINRLMDWDLPLDQAATIGGLVIDTTQMLPEEGVVVELFEHQVVITQVTGQRVAQLRLMSDAKLLIDGAN